MAKSWSRRKTSARSIAAGAVIAIVTAAGISWALWTVSGTGTVASKAGTLSAVVVTVPASGASGGLIPSGSANAKADLANGNSGDVRLTSLAQNGRATSPDSTCDAALTLGMITFATTGATYPITVPPAGLTNQTVGTVTAAANFANACQGKEIDVPVTTSTEVGS